MAIGEIIGIKDTFEFDTLDCQHPHACHVAGNIYAIVYTRLDGTYRGELITVEIINGQITEPAIDSYEFIAVSCEYPKIIHIDGTTYCAVYRDPNQYVAFRTFTIADNGQITEPELDTAEFPTTTWELDIQHVSAGIYVVLYGHGADRAIPVTWSIGGDGTLGDTEIAYLATLTADHTVSNLITIAQGIFAFSHSTGAGALGHVQTFSVSNDGLTIAFIDTLQIEDTALNYSHIFYVAANIYAVVYQTGLTAAKLVTFTISPAGYTGAAVIDSYVFEAGSIRNLSVAQVADAVFAIAYNGPDGDGWLKTVKIASDGEITEPFLDDFEFDIDNGADPWVWPTEGAYFPIAYTGPADDGFLKTLEIRGNEPQLGHTELMMGIGP